MPALLLSILFMFIIKTFLKKLALANIDMGFIGLRASYELVLQARRCTRIGATRDIAGPICVG